MSQKAEGKQSLPRAEWRIVAIYALGASLWIVASDQLLHWLEHGSVDPLRLQTFKGLNFVLTTSALLYVVLKRSYDRWRRAEEALRETQERFALAARAATDAIWDWDLITNAIWWSDGFYGLFGYSREEVQLTIESWTCCLHPDEKERVESGLRSAIDGGSARWTDEYRFRRKDGSYAFVHDHGFVIRNEAGKPIRMVGGISDITARKQAEQKLEASRLQLRALSGRIESLRDQEQSRIAREIHDELGQMLTGLKMDLRWIEKRLSEPSDATSNAILEKVIEAVQLTDATIASVQKISGELRPRLLDTLGLCAAIRSEGARFQERTGVALQVNCPEELSRLRGDISIAAFRIFQEALTNITRHAEATEVKVDLVEEATTLRMRIVDNGKGISPAELEAPNSLGLLGMRERAELLGGEVTIAANGPRGTVVTVHLPNHSRAPAAKADRL
jgi:two-component system, NarL family, sensor histidine kinase UhpB